MKGPPGRGLLRARQRRWTKAFERAANERITADHVTWGYRLFLDRDPESDAAVAEKVAGLRTTPELREAFFASAEYREKNPMLPHSKQSCVVIKEIGPGERLFVDLADRVIGLGVVNDSYEQPELDLVRRAVGPGQTTLDLGANIGLFTVVMAHLVTQAGRVYSFEPLPRNSDLLRRSIAENGYDDRVVLEEAAVSSSAATIELVVPEETTNWGGAYLRGAGEASRPRHRPLAVRAVVLDDHPIRRPVHFVKVDIEGAEPLALRGARRILTEDRPLVLAELNPGQLGRVSGTTATELIAEMAGFGYDCFHLSAGGEPLRLERHDGSDILSVLFGPRGRSLQQLLSGDR